MILFRPLAPPCSCCFPSFRPLSLVDKAKENFLERRLKIFLQLLPRSKQESFNLVEKKCVTFLNWDVGEEENWVGTLSPLYVRLHALINFMRSSLSKKEKTKKTENSVSPPPNNSFLLSSPFLSRTQPKNTTTAMEQRLWRPRLHSPTAFLPPARSPMGRRRLPRWLLQEWAGGGEDPCFLLIPQVRRRQRRKRKRE